MNVVFMSGKIMLVAMFALIYGVVVNVVMVTMWMNAEHSRRDTKRSTEMLAKNNEWSNSSEFVGLPRLPRLPRLKRYERERAVPPHQ